MSTIQIIRLIPLLLLLLFSALLSTGLFNGEAENESVEGQVMPAFNIDVINDENVKMTQETWRGQVAVVNIFASWCKPCHVEHAAIMRLAQSGKVNVYGIAWRDKAENVVAYLNAKGNPYQLVGNDPFGRTTIAFSLTGVPETMVVDRDGTVAFHTVSPITDDVVDDQILPLIDELNAAHVAGR